MGVFDLIKNNNYKKTTGVYAMIQADPSKREAEEKRREELRRQEELRIQQEQMKQSTAAQDPSKQQYWMAPREKTIGDKIANFFHATLPDAAENVWDKIKEPITGPSLKQTMTELKMSPKMLVEDSKEQMEKENPTWRDYRFIKPTQQAVKTYGLPTSSFKAINEDTTELQKQLNAAEKTWQVSPIDATASNTWAATTGIFGNLASMANSIGADKVPVLKEVTNFAVEGAKAAQQNAQQYNKGSYGKGLGTITQGVVNLVPYFVLGTGGAAVKGAEKVGKYAKYIEPIIKNPSFWYSLSSMWGQKYQEKIDEGYNRFEALGNAILYAVPSALVEVGGGIGASGKEGQSLLRTMGEEIGEEILQDLLSGTSDKIVTNHDLPWFSTTEDAVVNPKNLLETAAYTIPIVGIAGGANNIRANRINNKINEQIANERISQEMQDYKLNSPYSKYLPNNISQAVQNNVLPTQKIQETVQSAKIAGMTDIDIKRATDLNNMIQSGAKLYFYDPENLPQNIASAEIDKTKIANGFYANGVIYINKNSRNKVEQILGHELTHYLETTQSYNDLANAILDSEAFYSFLAEKGFNNIQEYKNSLKEYYSDEQLDSEMVARFVEEKLFTDQESINVLARQNSTLAQKIKAWIDDMVVKFTGTAQEKELRKIQNMYRKALEQAKNNTVTATDNAKYYIKNVASFNENEYNNIQEKQLPKKEYGKLAHIVDSDTTVMPGMNFVETSDATYVIYFKEYNDFKVVGKIEGGVVNDTVTDRNISRAREARNGQVRLQDNFNNVQEQSAEQSNDELLDGYKREGSIEIRSDKNITTNNGNVADGQSAFSMQKNNPKFSIDIDDKINASMTMSDAKRMIEMAFIDNGIYNWYDGKYSNGDEWLRGEGIDEVETYLDNTIVVLEKYLNPIYEKDEAYGDEYFTSDILQAYLDGTLVGSEKKKTTRLDVSKETQYTATKFYEPQEPKEGIELYNKASERVTNANRDEVYKARAEFIINAHNKGYIESLNLSKEEVNKKLKSWAGYTKKAMDLSNSLNEGVAKQNRWTGIENSSIVNTISISNEDLGKMVKEIKGDSSGWQRKYITSTMLALDTHIDYSNLTFEFDKAYELSKRSALGEYLRDTDTILIGAGYQNTVAHEIGHYIDSRWARDLGLKNHYLSDSYVKTDGLSKEQTQFVDNFKAFIEDIGKSSYMGSKYATGTRGADYWQHNTEIFARFVARFTEWTKNQATNNRYGYEDKHYQDYFTESQYREFVKILQEKASLDVASNSDTKFSIDVDNLNPTSNPDIRYSVNNPINIAKNPPNIETGLDEIKKRAKEKQGDSYSKFATSVQASSIFSPEIKRIARDNININTYNRLANKDVLIEANDKLNEGGQSEVTRLLSKSDKAFTPQDVAEAILLMDRYQQTGDYASAIEIMTKLRKAGTSGGQTIQMFSLLGRMTPQGMTFYAQKTLDNAYDEILKHKTQAWADENADKFKLTDKDIEYIQRRVNQASRLPEGRDKYVLLGEIAERIQDKIPPTAGQSTKSLARISMLLNPKTIVRNILGNLVIAPNHIISDFVGTGLDKAVSKKTGVRTTGTFRGKDTLKGMAKGAYESFDDFRRKISTRELTDDRFEIMREFGQGKNFNENHTGKLATQRNKLNKALNGLDRVTGFLLEAGDRPIYEGWFINSLNNQMELNKATSPTADMIEIATDEALQRTWQDNNTYTKAVNSVRGALNKFNIKGYGLGDMVMPFVKTPANLTKAVVDFSPLGAINAALKTSRFNKDIGKGAATSKQQREVVKAWSQVITGTLGMAIMAGLANAGALSGKGDEDKDVRAFEQNILGIKPYSIKIGDKTYTYDWAQPLGTTAAMVTDTMKSLKAAGNTENKVGAVLNGLQSGASVLLDQSFVSGIRNLFEEDNLINALIETAMNEPAKFTPQTLGQIAQIGDKKARTTYVYNDKLATGINKVKAKIPGLRQTLEPSVDVLGREVEVDNSVGNVMFNPANTAYARTTKAAEEMYNVYQATGDKAVIAQVAPYYFNNDGKKVILTPKLKTQYQKTLGKISSDGVEKLLNNKAYNDLQSTDKAEILKALYSYAGAMAKKEADVTYSIPKDIQKIVDSKLSPEEYILLRYIANSSGSKKDEMYNGLIESGYSKKNTESFLTEYKGYKFTTNAKNTLPTYTSKQSKLPTFLSQNTISLSKSKK